MVREQKHSVTIDDHTRNLRETSVLRTTALVQRSWMVEYNIQVVEHDDGLFLYRRRSQQ